MLARSRTQRICFDSFVWSATFCCFPLFRALFSFFFPPPQHLFRYNIIVKLIIYSANSNIQMLRYQCSDCTVSAHSAGRRQRPGWTRLIKAKYCIWQHRKKIHFVCAVWNALIGIRCVCVRAGVWVSASTCAERPCIWWFVDFAMLGWTYSARCTLINDRHKSKTLWFYWLHNHFDFN